MSMQQVVTRLRALADGSYTPRDRNIIGVCAVFHDACTLHGVNGIERPNIFDIFTALGYDDDLDPLGTYGFDDLYDDVIGPPRRALAGRVADYLEKHYT